MADLEPVIKRAPRPDALGPLPQISQEIAAGTLYILDNTPTISGGGNDGIIDGDLLIRKDPASIFFNNYYPAATPPNHYDNQIFTIKGASPLNDNTGILSIDETLRVYGAEQRVGINTVNTLVTPPDAKLEIRPGAVLGEDAVDGLRVGGQVTGNGIQINEPDTLTTGHAILIPAHSGAGDAINIVRTGSGDGISIANTGTGYSLNVESGATKISGQIIYGGTPDVVVAATPEPSMDQLISYLDGTAGFAVTWPGIAPEEGTMKILIMTNSANPVTVPIAGAGSPKVFNATGDAGTFLFTNAGWYCVGANNI
jgi:hypothetical protein